MNDTFQRRIYPLSASDLSEEEMAAVFAMTSRTSEPLDEVSRTVSPESASEFHERWVLGRGHASVSEHSVVRLAVENISRLACDSLEDNRLGSYTEKSSRYQVIQPGFYHVPRELEGNPLRETYVQACDTLLTTYHCLMDEVTAYVRSRTTPRESEPASSYEFRTQHQAADSCRFLLPAATLTNVGVTMNARSLRHAIEKLLSSELVEEHNLAEDMRAQAESILPTLLKRSQPSSYLVQTREAQKAESLPLKGEPDNDDLGVKLVQYDPDAEQRVAAAILYHYAGVSYQEVWDRVRALPPSGLEKLLDEGLKRTGPHESPIRELEYTRYTFEFLMDYGAYREFKRHRMQVYMAQPLTVDRGYVLPELIVEAGKESEFQEAMASAERGFHEIAEFSPAVARYLVTHGHKCRVLSQMDVRQLYHFLRMRNSPHAHFTIRHAAAEAMRLVGEKHPLLLRYLQMRTGQ